jgi:hypothetical protein
VWCPGQNKRIAPLSWKSLKATKGLIALTPEIDCNKTAMALPPVTSVVFLIANKFWLNVGVSEEYLKYLSYPFGDKA